MIACELICTFIVEAEINKISRNRNTMKGLVTSCFTCVGTKYVQSGEMDKLSRYEFTNADVAKNKKNIR